MTAYQYKGYDARGKAVTGEVSAISVEEVERKLASTKVTIISIVPLLAKEKARAEAAAKRKIGPPSRPVSGRKVRIDEIAAILRNMAVMAETGVPLPINSLMGIK